MGEIDFYIRRLGENIVRLRKERNITQIDLALRLDIEDSALRRIEKGRTNPTVKTLYFIAKELNVELKDLFDF